MHRRKKETSRIEFVALCFKAIKIVGFLADLELELMDVLEIVLPEAFPLLSSPTLGRAHLLRCRRFRLRPVNPHSRHCVDGREGALCFFENKF